MTRFQAWARRRDLTMASGHLQGASLRFLGDVFDVDPARVSRVLARLRAEFAPIGGLTAANLVEAIRVSRLVESDRQGSTQVGSAHRLAKREAAGKSARGRRGVVID